MRRKPAGSPHALANRAQAKRLAVVDQELGYLYAGQEQFGIWRFDAAPNGSTEGTSVDRVAPDGPNLQADVEGLTIYYAGDGKGYLLVSSQGDNTFAVYDRQTNVHLGSFRVGSRGKIDSVEESDGADVVNVSLGGGYSKGLLVVQDGQNDPPFLVEDDDEFENVNTNFKFVRWDKVAKAFPDGLLIDTESYHPRSD
jgi:3-phytase